MMSEDAQLLRRYATERSEAAFAELIRRHVDLVYSAALRQVAGDAHGAQDVTQQVFSELARQAKPLARHPALAGWLYTATRQIAAATGKTGFLDYSTDRLNYLIYKDRWMAFGEEAALRWVIGKYGAQ